VRALWPFLLFSALAGCTDVPALVARGTNPKESHEDRIEALDDALSRREPVVPDLIDRTETLLANGGEAEKAAALDVLDALVRSPEKSARALVVRLADSDSPLLASKEALRALVKHRDPTVRGLAKEKLAALK
jgi:hypothetical protein